MIFGRKYLLPRNLRVHFRQHLVAVFGVLAILWGLLSCSAPHDNPLDPESDDYVPNAGRQYGPEDFRIRVRSLHSARPFSHVYSVLAELWTEELIPIDSASVTFEARKAIGLDPTVQGIWGTLFASGYFGSDPQMEYAIGRPFVFSVWIRDDSSFTLGPAYLSRVIVETPILIHPMNSDTVQPFVTLEWEPFSAEYFHEYRTSLWRNELDFVAEIWTSDTLHADTSQIGVPDSLQNGNYFWTLLVIDRFGNSSRSVEGKFRVQVETQP